MAAMSILRARASQGPEIRTGFLKDAKPVQLREGQEVTMTTDYDIKGDEKMIAMSYKKLAVDLKPGNTILCADGTITLTVLSCDPQAGTVRCRCENTAVIGERKNVNLHGVVVDLPTLTEKENWPEEGTIPLNSMGRWRGMAILRNKTKKTKRSQSGCDIGRYAVAFAVGLGLAGAGLLLGWTMGWLFTVF